MVNIPSLTLLEDYLYCGWLQVIPLSDYIRTRSGDHHNQHHNIQWSGPSCYCLTRTYSYRRNISLLQIQIENKVPAGNNWLIGPTGSHLSEARNSCYGLSVSLGPGDVGQGHAPGLADDLGSGGVAEVHIVRRLLDEHRTRG